MCMESRTQRNKSTAKNITVESTDGIKYTDDPYENNTKIADNFNDIADKCLNEYTLNHITGFMHDKCQ